MRNVPWSLNFLNCFKNFWREWGKWDGLNCFVMHPDFFSKRGKFFLVILFSVASIVFSSKWNIKMTYLRASRSSEISMGWMKAFWKSVSVCEVRSGKITRERSGPKRVVFQLSFLFVLFCIPITSFLIYPFSILTFSYPGSDIFFASLILLIVVKHVH